MKLFTAQALIKGAFHRKPLCMHKSMVNQQQQIVFDCIPKILPLSNRLTLATQL